METNKKIEALNNYAEAFSNPRKVWSSFEETSKFIGSINELLYGDLLHTEDETMFRNMARLGKERCVKEGHSFADNGVCGSCGGKMEDDFAKQYPDSKVGNENE